MGFLDSYPYTNWHNVNLDWVLERVKELMSKVDELENYVTNLDYQDMINKTIAGLINNGTFQTIVNPIIGNYVTNWLRENITVPEGIVIDESLTIAGAAADAKSVGDRIAIDGFNIPSKYALLDLISELEYRNRNGRNYLNVLETLLNIENFELSAVIPQSLVLYGAISSNPVGYPSTNPNSKHYNNTSNLYRACYTYFSLSLRAGVRYRIIINSFYPNTQVALFRLTEAGFNLASTGQTMPFNSSNIYDMSGFQLSGYEFTVDEDCYIWLSFRVKDGTEEVEMRPEYILDFALYNERS